MSTHPLRLIQKVIKFSKIIYVHKEVNENLNDLQKYMLDHNVIPGIALHSNLIMKILRKILRVLKR